MERQSIALVAHDNMKPDMVAWVKWNHKQLMGHKIICTGTTGSLVKETLDKFTEGTFEPETEMVRLKSGPLGGDQQLGAMVAEGGVDILIFFWDAMEQQAHDADAKALLRIAVLYNIPTVSNRSSADYLISSPLFGSKYEPARKDYKDYLLRTIKK